jgi:vacuolar-type H+-ATPase subunit H
MNDCFRNAQKAAGQYLSEIRAIREETEEERRRILARARAEAAAMLKKYRQDHLDNG